MRASRPTLSRRDASRPWVWQHYAALVASVFLVWEAWTLIAWTADGVHQVTAFRDGHSANWYSARVAEALLVALAAVLLAKVITECRREHRLTWDAQFCIAALLAFWIDPLANFYQPGQLLYSSNFVNVANWCSHTPLVVNKRCGDMPEPVIFIGLLYAFGFLAAAIVGGAVLRAVRRRAPAISNGRLLVICGLFGVVCDMVLEMTANLLHLWNYPSYPRGFALMGGGHRYPLIIAIGAFYFFGAVTAIRFFKDDRGRTVFERGLDRMAVRRQTTLSLLATIAVTQVLALTATLFLVVAGPYAQRWSKEPHYIINGVCNAPGFTNTAYGQCPGEPGFKLPIRTTGLTITH